MTCTETALREMIKRHGGFVASGQHENSTGPLCLMELHSACLVADGDLDEITDDPDVLGLADYRAINDAPWSSREAATEPLIRLHIAFTDWGQWTEERKRRVADQVIIGTLRNIIAELPQMPDDMSNRCRNVSTVIECSHVLVALDGEAIATRGRAAVTAAEMAATALNVESAMSEAAWAAGVAASAARRGRRRTHEEVASIDVSRVNESSETDKVLLRTIDLWCAAASDSGPM